VAAITAPACGIVFEKFNRMFAFGAFGIEYGPRFPVFRILSRAFHGVSFPADMFPSDVYGTQYEATAI